MRFSDTEASFVAAHPRLRRCVLPYASLKEVVRDDGFFDRLEDAVRRADRNWSLCARGLIAAYRVVGENAALGRAAELLRQAGRLTRTGIRKICKKRDKLVPGGGAREWHEREARDLKSSGALSTDLAALTDAAPPECPVCLAAVDAPVAFPCGHALCGACAATLRQCPVCRRARGKRPLPAWRRREWSAKVPVPANTVAILGAYALG